MTYFASHITKFNVKSLINNDSLKVDYCKAF